MNITFTINYNAYFDIEQAKEDFYEILYWNPIVDINKAMHDAVEENITWPIEVDDLPNEVVETAVNALRTQIGGIQIRMEGI